MEAKLNNSLKLHVIYECIFKESVLIERRIQYGSEYYRNLLNDLQFIAKQRDLDGPKGGYTMMQI
uniref:Uncharacterized protein n=1 Tax=Romanomermis culicivorax TaxID=13658 RepID=A0A915I7F4_ROMCU